MLELCRKWYAISLTLATRREYIAFHFPLTYGARLLGQDSRYMQLEWTPNCAALRRLCAEQKKFWVQLGCMNNKARRNDRRKPRKFFTLRVKTWDLRSLQSSLHTSITKLYSYLSLVPGIHIHLYFWNSSDSLCATSLLPCSETKAEGEVDTQQHQEPFSQTSRNFSGLSRVPQVLYIFATPRF